MYINCAQGRSQAIAVARAQHGYTTFLRTSREVQKLMGIHDQLRYYQRCTGGAQPLVARARAPACPGVATPLIVLLLVPTTFYQLPQMKKMTGQ